MNARLDEIPIDGKCGYEYEETLESKIVSDADNIDRFGAYRIYQRMIWEQNGDKKTIEEKIADVENLLERLDRYYNGNILQTESGNIKFKEQLELQIHFYNKYSNELRMTKLPTL